VPVIVTEAINNILCSCERVAFFGGAGVSTESGIPDFKSPDGLYNGLWRGYRPEDILHKRFFHEHTDLFYEFYFSKMVHNGALPNAAHLALASLERAGRLSGVVTQNIDGLHQAAGSVNVAELHGSVHRNRCMGCAAEWPLRQMLVNAPDVPLCPNCGGILKPDVVLYGENLSEKVLDAALLIIGNADCIIVGGTSLSVYPAAGLLDYFGGKYLILVNKEETPYDKAASAVVRRPIGDVLGELVFGGNTIFPSN
jgi:NAD-dependent deacetylase